VTSGKGFSISRRVSRPSSADAQRNRPYTTPSKDSHIGVI
jgi:hypothetical protein